MTQSRYYRIVSATRRIDLELAVDKYLELGWEPVGSIAVMNVSRDSKFFDPCYLQAVWKPPATEVIVPPRPRDLDEETALST